MFNTNDFEKKIPKKRRYIEKDPFLLDEQERQISFRKKKNISKKDSIQQSLEDNYLD